VRMLISSREREKGVSVTKHHVVPSSKTGTLAHVGRKACSLPFQLPVRSQENRPAGNSPYLAVRECGHMTSPVRGMSEEHGGDSLCGIVVLYVGSFYVSR
jgi:hypothetical protein